MRVDTPDFEPYTNSLIVNHRVYVPTCEGRPAANADAIAGYEAAMPGYEVIGISKLFGGIDLWQPDWALHCDTMGIPDEQMLYIEHTPVLDRPCTTEGIPIGAKIVAFSGKPFVAETPVVIWKAQGEDDWNQSFMTHRSDLGDDRYVATIPAQPIGTVVQYYLHAEDASGRSENHPYIGAPQAHTFAVKPFGADVSAVSANKGGTIDFYLNAGADGAQQDYSIQYTLELEEPGMPTEGLPETAVLTGFQGTLDDSGIASARLFLPAALPGHWVEGALHFDLTLDQSPETVIDRVTVQILE